MARKSRDRGAEMAAITAAAGRLLAGTPLRSTSGKLTTTELITESGLRRDVVYEHDSLVEDFQARVKAQNSTPTAMQELTDNYETVRKERDKVKAELTAEQNTNGILRKIVAELSLEIDQAKEELSASQNITHMADHARRSAAPRP
jgi:chromosome segregation ATPase